MRVLAGALGIFLFGAGLLFLGFGAASAVQTSDNLGSQGSDWACTADATSSRCDLSIGGVPRDHASMMGDLAATVAGGALAVSGAVFVLIGFGAGGRPLAAPAQALPARPAVQPAQYRPAHAGQPPHQAQHAGPQQHGQRQAQPTGPQPTGQHQGQPTGPQPTGQQQHGQQQPGQWPSPPSSGDTGQAGPSDQR